MAAAPENKGRKRGDDVFETDVFFEEENLDELRNELDELKAAIKKVEGEIDRVETELLAGPDEKTKEYLREEKKSLREKEKSLREEKNLRLRKMDFTPAEVPSGTPSRHHVIFLFISHCSSVGPM